MENENETAFIRRGRRRAEAHAVQIVQIQGKYSKLKLDGICANNGGQSYGTASGVYGCAKNNVSVECQKDGTCTGHIFFQAGSGGGSKAGNPAAVLQQSQTPVKRGTVGGASGVPTTSQ